VEFRLLGPVEVSVAGRTATPAEPRQRAVLAALVVHAGWTVSTETLIDRVWGDRPPAQGRRTLHTHLSRLRALLDGPGRGSAPPRPVRDAGGYRLAVLPEQVDLHRFHKSTTRARDAGMSPRERAEVLRTALALWRGEALAGLSGSWVEGQRRAWAQDRLTATLTWAEAETQAGEAEAILGPLAQLLAEQPLVEPAVALLMRALASVGRTADALDQFHRTRRHLREELGSEPGPELRAVQRLPLHGARHVAASVLGDLGVPDVAVAAWLGQATVATTRGYQHVMRDRLVEAAGQLGDALTG